ncbi:gliding motility-associated-like protein [Ancylomarina subtilis]|uniref:Gliding motility-associated-like protein n=2 Tax=Ancylomarina subtilis TaxID=1639035 RepID=A0A4Q7VL06_9BACT|nr:gliding motility-associated-like protein [Ancylomarina subtilis]
MNFIHPSIKNLYLTMKSIFTLSFILVLLFGPTLSFGQDGAPPVAKNDSVSINNKTLIDEVNYIEIVFLENDIYSSSTLDFSQTKILRQNDQAGKAYLVENNTLMVFYPYEDSFGVDTIFYEICNNRSQCSQAYILVDVKNPNKVDLLIPTAFSPNGDNINDKFYIKGIENYPVNEFVVFSRWGSKVFDKSNYTNDDAWDGSYSKTGVKLGPGDKLPPGTYFFKLIIKDKKYLKSGYIVIKK